MDTILILGGYGFAGLPLARALLEHTPAQVIVAGRSLDRAEAAAGALNAEAGGQRARGIRADVTDAASLADAFKGVDLAIDCTPSTANIATTARAALEAGVDYLEILFGPGKMAALEALGPEIEAAGRCFICEAGYHPGLPSALVRYAAGRLAPLETAVVAGLIHQPLPYTEAVDELIHGMDDMPPLVYRDGAWQTESWTTYRPFDFGPPFGKHGCVPMDFYEMHALPDMLGLKETAFYIAGFGWLSDWLVMMPWYLFKLGRTPRGARLGAKLLCWSSRVTMRPPYGVVLKLEAAGCVDGRPARLALYASHADGYVFTAIPVAACVMQWLDGAIRRPGLHVMGQLVDPPRLMADMQRMDIAVREELDVEG